MAAFALACLLLAAAAISGAETKAPSLDRATREPERSSAMSVALARHSRIAGIQVAQDSVGAVLAKLGVTGICRADSGEEASWVLGYRCYGSEYAQLTFEAGVAGGWNTITQYRVERLAPPSRCDRAPFFQSSPLRTPGGLRLGVDRSAVRALCGRPTRTTVDTWEFESTWIEEHGGETFEGSATLAVHFEAGRVDRFEFVWIVMS
jgi:hypothetical protein